MSRLLAALLLVHSAAAFAQGTQAPGYAALVAAYGDRLPDGSGVHVAQVEPPARILGDDKDSTRRSHIPERSRREYEGVTFANVGAAAPDGSGHATTTATRFYGRSGSASPGVATVDLFTANAFLSKLDRPSSLGAARVWNHSWVGTLGEQDAHALRAFDRAASRQGWIAVAGVNNNGNNPPLLSAAFNVLSVGRSDGGHAVGAAVRKGAYAGQRNRPHLVAPATHTSAAAPKVASVAALLLDTLLTDEAGRALDAATQGRAVRAALLAGAARRFARTPQSGAAYASPDARTANGLDPRYGAGEVDAWTSYHILRAGPSVAHDDLAANGFAVRSGVAQAAGVHAPARFGLAPLADGTLSIALLWDWPAAGTDAPADLDLALYEVTGQPVAVAQARGRSDTGEHVFADVAAGKRYVVEVSAARAQDASTPFALAWANRVAD